MWQMTLLGIIKSLALQKVHESFDGVRYFLMLRRKIDKIRRKRRWLGFLQCQICRLLFMYFKQSRYLKPCKHAEGVNCKQACNTTRSQFLTSVIIQGYFTSCKPFYFIGKIQNGIEFSMSFHIRTEQTILGKYFS